MPNINVTTNYAGEVLQNILAKAALGNEIAEKGIIHVVPGIQKKLSIPRMQVNGRLLQARKSRIAIDGSDSQGDINYDERVLEPQDMMVYTEFNPATMESTWRPYQPKGNLVFEQLPPSVQNQMLDLILKQTGSEVGDNYINCIKTNTDGDFFNGLVARIMGDKDTVFAKKGAQTWVGKLQNVFNAIPDEIIDNPNLKIIMNTSDYNAYDAELKAQYAKNVDPTQKREQQFDSIPIVRLAKWPKGLVVATLASLGEDSNFWAAVNLENDDNVLLVDKVNNASEIYFIKILMKADVNIAWGEFVVVLDERKQGTATLASTVVSASGKASTYKQTAALNAAATYTISTTGAYLGQTVTVSNEQSGNYAITIGSTAIAKGKAASFRYSYNSDGNLAWMPVTEAE